MTSETRPSCENVPGNDEGPSTHELEGPCRVLRAAVADRSASIGLAGPVPRPAPPRSLEVRQHAEPAPHSVCRRRSLGARSVAEHVPHIRSAADRSTAAPTVERDPMRGLAIARPSTPRNPSLVPETRLPATVSREPAASRRSPSGSVSVSGDKESSSGVRPAGTRGFPQLFLESPVSTSRSTAGDPVVPRTERLSTARPRVRPHPPVLMSTIRTSIRSGRHRHRACRNRPDWPIGRRRPGSAGSRARSRCRAPRGNPP